MRTRPRPPVAFMGGSGATSGTASGQPLRADPLGPLKRIPSFDPNRAKAKVAQTLDRFDRTGRLFYLRGLYARAFEHFTIVANGSLLADRPVVIGWSRRAGPTRWSLHLMRRRPATHKQTPHFYFIH